MNDKQFYGFYNWFFFSAFFPFWGYIFLFIPETIAGFSLTGWAWMIMFIVAIYYFILRYNQSRFPHALWLPWVFYVVIYLIYKFSFPGFQLTLQYIVPILVGVVASSFDYNKEKLHWLYKRMFIISAAVVAQFAYGYLFRNAWTPYAAATPMLLSVMAALSVGIFYITKNIKYLLLFVALFLVPFIDVTRMGMAVFLVIFIFHFANKKVFSKIVFSSLGVIAVIIVFNSKGFQEKTFFEGSGSISDLSLNYYEPTEMMNTSGRSGFYQFYEKGLKMAPLMGNGPRADMYVLRDVWGGLGVSEAHNDYLAVRYNYGYVGLGLLLFGFIMTFISIYIKFSKEKEPYKILLQSTVMILTVTSLLYMYSDNILKATVFFTDYYFALIGMVYAKYEN